MRTINGKFFWGNDPQEPHSYDYECEVNGDGWNPTVECNIDGIPAQDYVEEGGDILSTGYSTGPDGEPILMGFEFKSRLHANASEIQFRDEIEEVMEELLE